MEYLTSTQIEELVGAWLALPENQRIAILRDLAAAAQPFRAESRFADTLTRPVLHRLPTRRRRAGKAPRKEASLT